MELGWTCFFISAIKINEILISDSITWGVSTIVFMQNTNCFIWFTMATGIFLCCNYKTILSFHAMYDKLIHFLSRFLKPATIFKVLFNLSPMYRRSTGRISAVSQDLLRIQVRIPLSFKNRNYAGSVFGGSLFSATDPIYMLQLIQVLGKGYVVWDKAASIRFKKPARETVYALFEFTREEIEQIRRLVAESNEITFQKQVDITNSSGTLYCVVEREIYIADKAFYQQKLQARHAK